MASIGSSSRACREKEEGENPDSSRRIWDYFLGPIAFNDGSSREDYCLHVFSDMPFDVASMKCVLLSVRERDC
jgi:hypothetical protein